MNSIMCEDANKSINDNDCSSSNNYSLESDARIAELVLVSTMYPGQLICSDIMIQSALDSGNLNINFNQSIDVDFIVDQFLQVHINLPVKFPQEKLQVHCRIVNTGLDRKLQNHLNDELKKHSTLDNLLEVILTINQVWSDLDKKPAKENKTDNQKTNEGNSNTVQSFFFND